MPILALGVTVAYLPFLGDPAFAPKWAVLCAVPWILLWQNLHIGVAGRGHLLGLALLAWAGLSLAWTPNLADGIAAWFQLALLGGAFVLAARETSLKAFYTAFAVGICINSATALYQWCFLPTPYFLSGPDSNPYPGALFLNSTYLGEAAALVLVAMVAQRRWWLAVGCLPALALSHSRVGLVAVAAAGLVWLWDRGWALYAEGRFREANTRLYTTTALLGVVVFACLYWTGSPSAIARINIWLDTLSGFSLWGHGIGSFWSTIPAFASYHDPFPIRYAHPHEEFLRVLFELGVLGLLAVCVLAFGAFHYAMGVERVVLAAVLAEALLSSPLYSPATGLMAVVVVGHVCSVWYGLGGVVNLWGLDRTSAKSQSRASDSRLGTRSEGMAT